MPTYDYKCPDCETVFEVFQRMKDAPKAKCPKCGAKAERQLSGGHGLVFKGSGFYETDYKRAGEKRGKQEKSETKEGGKPSSGGAGPSGASGASGSSSSSGPTG